MALIHRTKQPKYNNKKVVYDNIKFDSKKEMIRYTELKILEKAKKITDLELQKKLIIQDKFKTNQGVIREINYIADFYYFDVDLDKYVIEDVKSIKTKDFILKFKLILNKYDCVFRLNSYLNNKHTITDYIKE
ncbi:DUF1064 domain-containing protein [bacterium]|nr:DUF1064 domain-containing protein [bacterium]